jgi:hypothetical protein
VRYPVERPGLLDTGVVSEGLGIVTREIRPYQNRDQSKTHFKSDNSLNHRASRPIPVCIDQVIMVQTGIWTVHSYEHDKLLKVVVLRSTFI